VLDRLTAESAAGEGREQWIVGLSGALRKPDPDRRDGLRHPN